MVHGHTRLASRNTQPNTTALTPYGLTPYGAPPSIVARPSGNFPVERFYIYVFSRTPVKTIVDTKYPDVARHIPWKLRLPRIIVSFGAGSVGGFVRML